MPYRQQHAHLESEALELVVYEAVVLLGERYCDGLAILALQPARQGQQQGKPVTKSFKTFLDCSINRHLLI